MDTRAMARRSSKQAGGTILVVDDHPLWRQMLGKLLLHNKVASRVIEAADGAEAVELARQHEPDVVVMDMAMPGLDGVQATSALREAAPESRVLALSSLDDRAQVLAAVRAGASGYLVKTAGPDDIVDAVRRIRHGELVFAPELAGHVLEELRSGRATGYDDTSAAEPGVARPRRGDVLERLTKREMSVLQLMAEGLSNQAICERFTLSPKTVEAHVRNIFMKLDLEDSPEEHRRVRAVLAYVASIETQG
jgi:DNA-binding NarL/FixJ family response regulator